VTGYRDTNLRLPKRGRIIDAVSTHANDVTVAL
jgi:hypothetical protein